MAHLPGHEHPTVHSEGEPVNVTIEGLQALYRAFNLAADRLHSMAQEETIRSAHAVAVRAKQEAQSQGLVDSGALMDNITSEAAGTSAWIKTTANRNGYPYPGRYEFGDRQRPFLKPALDREFDHIVSRFQAVIQRAINFAED